MTKKKSTKKTETITKEVSVDKANTTSEYSWTTGRPICRPDIRVKLHSKPVLGDLAPGETFVFQNAVYTENVYQVLSQKVDNDPELIMYVLLNTGAVYTSRKSKSILPVKVKFEVTAV